VSCDVRGLIVTAMAEWGTTSWEIIQGAARGDTSAQAEFAAIYGVPLRAYFRSLQGRYLSRGIDVDDLVQDVFVECMKREGALTRADAGRGPFQYFLRGVAHNVAMRAVAGPVHHLSADTEAMDMLVAEDLTASRVFDREYAQAILLRARALMAQSSDERLGEILRLRSEEGLSLGEVAARLNMTAQMVRNLNEKARAAFERTLLQVLESDDPSATRGEVVARAKDLIRLLRGHR
jgi:RNA polymerase sigma factor (sigma-70 family)